MAFFIIFLWTSMSQNLHCFFFPSSIFFFFFLLCNRIDNHEQLCSCFKTIVTDVIVCKASFLFPIQHDIVSYNIPAFTCYLDFENVDGILQQKAIQDKKCIENVVRSLHCCTKHVTHTELNESVMLVDTLPTINSRLIKVCKKIQLLQSKNTSQLTAREK